MTAEQAERLISAMQQIAAFCAVSEIVLWGWLVISFIAIIIKFMDAPQ